MSTDLISRSYSGSKATEDLIYVFAKSCVCSNSEAKVKFKSFLSLSLIPPVLPP